VKAGGGDARILWARHMTVTVHEEKNGKEMDLGPFSYTLSLLLDEQPTSDAQPTFYGRVKGEVDVGGPEDHGRIDLHTYKVRDGTSQVIPVWADANAGLEIQEQQPASLEVKLWKDAKQLRSDKTKWLLEVTVPSDSPSGPLPENSAIVLRLTSPTPRLVRIPVMGSAIAD